MVLNVSPRRSLFVMVSLVCVTLGIATRSNATESMPTAKGVEEAPVNVMHCELYSINWDESITTNDKWVYEAPSLKFDIDLSKPYESEPGQRVGKSLYVVSLEKNAELGFYTYVVFIMRDGGGASKFLGTAIDLKENTTFQSQLSASKNKSGVNCGPMAIDF